MKIFGDLKLTLSFGISPTDTLRIAIFCMPSLGAIYRTSSHAGIRTLFTLLRFDASRIKKYGIDFYANQEEYSKENTDFLNANAHRLGHAPHTFARMHNFLSFYRSNGFSIHDPLSNFCFAQNLYQAGMFEIERWHHILVLHHV